MVHKVQDGLGLGVREDPRISGQLLGRCSVRLHLLPPGDSFGIGARKVTLDMRLARRPPTGVLG